ncbi:MAG TPA: tyrosine-protein phosphatase [Novosphingobium sp.]|nr:tyrosine-protein phosphatase [Novosphingobium sp.]
MSEPSRILALEGIHNFRDYGGYAGADGARVRSRVLWRSSHHAEASPADLRKIHDLGLARVFDLRGDSEREAHPCLRHPEFAAEVVFAPGETAGLRAAAFHEEAAGGVRTVDDAISAMVRLYEGMAWRPVLVETLKLYFASLAQADGPLLLHCVAGKDRTGLAAALTHHALGVHPDDAMADYLLTHQAANIDARIAAGAGSSLRALGPEMSDDAVRALVSVRPEYLETALGAIRARHGAIDDYMAEVLEVTPDRKASIRARLLS